MAVVNCMICDNSLFIIKCNIYSICTEEFTAGEIKKVKEARTCLLKMLQ
jgi:hypothetical protein